jgi:hypothetical protein
MHTYTDLSLPMDVLYYITMFVYSAAIYLLCKYWNKMFIEVDLLGMPIIIVIPYCLMALCNKTINEYSCLMNIHVKIILFSVWCFVDHCLVFCHFSFSHCVVCPSAIYGFWLLHYNVCLLCCHLFVVQILE